MKLEELNRIRRKLGLSPFSIQDIEVNPTELVVGSAFTHSPSSGDYRAQAYGELLAQGLPFTCDSNLVDTIARGLITVHCPYCDADMAWEGGGGNFEVHSLYYRCPEQHEVRLTLTTNGISIKKGA